jgi:hypothetical protein
LLSQEAADVVKRLSSSPQVGNVGGKDVDHALPRMGNPEGEDILYTWLDEVTAGMP